MGEIHGVIKIIGYLFSPLSISMYICSLTLSFLSFYDGPNSDFIEWHTLLSLLILSAINEIIKHYVYKQHEPYDEGKQKIEENKIRETEMVFLMQKNNRKILHLLIRKFGKHIADLIWVLYANKDKPLFGDFDSNLGLDEMEYYKSLRTMDNVLRLYYKHNNVEYDFYDSFYHFVDFKMHQNKEYEQINFQKELSEDAEYKNYSYLDFNADFPFNANNEYKKNNKRRIIFRLLQICYNLSQGIYEYASNKEFATHYEEEAFNEFLKIVYWQKTEKT